MRFEWDPQKDVVNQRKHGLSFEIASRVFDDPLQLNRLDRVVDNEERWQTMGQLDGIVLVLVAHALKSVEDEEVIRIISARRATSHERKQYEQQ